MKREERKSGIEEKGKKGIKRNKQRERENKVGKKVERIVRYATVLNKTLYSYLLHTIHMSKVSIIKYRAGHRQQVSRQSDTLFRAQKTV